MVKPGKVLSDAAAKDSIPSKGAMLKNFADVFLTVYRQKLTSFYDEALPDVQYVFDHQLRI